MGFYVLDATQNDSRQVCRVTKKFGSYGCRKEEREGEGRECVGEWQVFWLLPFCLGFLSGSLGFHDGVVPSGSRCLGYVPPRRFDEPGEDGLQTGNASEEAPKEGLARTGMRHRFLLPLVT
jgi:hypothetical protein